MEGVMKPLTGRIALVAGATRGVGRGIACMLGEAGATVYCTGRSVAGHPPAHGHYAGRPETIEQTAGYVTERGGTGRAVQIDHGRAEDVERLALEIAGRERRLDVLVLDFWGDESLVPFGTPFWQIPFERARDTIDRTLWPHVITLRRLVPLMLEKPGSPPPLIVEVVDGPALYYRASLYYDLAATLRARLAYAAA
jgi:NAD(P)-dependent dehydrogenase (short-subunit alcohol dehydrogenase family)